MSLILSQINKDNVKVGKGCCIALGVQIISEIGEIIIGDYTIIEEGCIIRNNQFKKMVIGSYNVFEIGCKVENANIGDCNVFEMRCTTVRQHKAQLKVDVQLRIIADLASIQEFPQIELPQFLQMPPYDSSQHKEEISELCAALFQMGSKK